MAGTVRLRSSHSDVSSSKSIFNDDLIDETGIGRAPRGTRPGDDGLTPGEGGLSVSAGRNGSWLCGKSEGSILLYGVVYVGVSVSVVERDTSLFVMFVFGALL